MTTEEVKKYEKKIKKASKLANKVSNLKDFLDKLDRREIRAGGITQKKIPEPVETSSGFCWQNYIFEHIDYEKLDVFCREEVKRQTLEQLKIAEKELANFSF